MTYTATVVVEEWDTFGVKHTILSEPYDSIKPAYARERELREEYSSPYFVDIIVRADTEEK